MKSHRELANDWLDRWGLGDEISMSPGAWALTEDALVALLDEAVNASKLARSPKPVVE